MAELLDFAIEAHGGMARWRALRSIAATVSPEGSLWQAKGKAEFVVDTTVRADCHRQYITYAPFIDLSTRSVFDGNRVVIESSDGRELRRRENPRAAFAGHTRMTPWDDLHLAYFTGYAMWNYLTVPFLFTWPGFRCAEIEPWQEDGELGRRLKVTIPSLRACHGRRALWCRIAAGCCLGDLTATRTGRAIRWSRSTSLRCG